MTSWIAQDMAPVADFRWEGNWKADARRGSRKLLTAILRAHSPRPPPPKRVRMRPGMDRKRPRVSYPRMVAARERDRENVVKVQQVVCQHFGIKIGDLIGPRGDETLSRRRQIAMLVARLTTNASYPDLGGCFKRDHSTVMYGCTRVSEFDADVIAICAKLAR